MPDGSILGVTPATNAVTQLLFASNSVFPSLADATSIGGLAQDTTELNTLGQLDSNVATNVYKFNLESGNNIKLNFNNQTNTAGVRVQLLDVTGNVVADNYGTAAQQAAYEQLDSSTGLTKGTGTYYVQLSYAPGAGTTPDPQSYNFQLLSGTTYTNAIVTSTQTQAYDPNLFVSATASVTPSSNLSLYTQTATLPTTGTAANALNVGNLTANETELDGLGSITNTDRTDYYSFNFTQGNHIKLAVANTTNSLESTPLHVQLLDTKGNVLADSAGTAAQQQAYTELTSGVGLSAANGQYLVKIEATPGDAVTATQSYNFQLLSGTSYNTIYKTTADLPTATSDSNAGTNLGVFANSQAQLYTRSGYNTIGETVNSATNVGWLAENQSSLNVVSQLTGTDNTDYYSFTLQPTSTSLDESAPVPIKFAFANTTGTSNVRVQLLDISGLHVIADNYGTTAQKAAFAQLTSSTGYETAPAQYTVKVSYAPGTNTTNAQTYNFQLYSGDSYLNSYQTTLSAQTAQNAILQGSTNVTGTYSTAASAATYLNSVSNGTSGDALSVLSTFA